MSGLDLFVAITGLAALAATILFLALPVGRKVGARLRGALKGDPNADLLRRHTVFISYRRQDSDYIADRLYKQLGTALGTQTVFKDVDSIPKGADYRDHIGACLATCRVFLLVVGKEWMGQEDGGTRRIDRPDDFMRLEIEIALARQIVLIPVLVANAKMPDKADLPPDLAALARKQATKLRADIFEEDVKRLVREIEPHLATPNIA